MATFDDLNLDRSSEWPSTPPVRHRPGVVVALTLLVLAAYGLDRHRAAV